MRITLLIYIYRQLPANFQQTEFAKNANTLKCNYNAKLLRVVGILSFHCRHTNIHLSTINRALPATYRSNCIITKIKFRQIKLRRFYIE